MLYYYVTAAGGSHNFDAGEEAASVPVVSTRRVWAQLWPEGALVSPVRQYLSRTTLGAGTEAVKTLKIHFCNDMFHYKMSKN